MNLNIFLQQFSKWALKRHHGTSEYLVLARLMSSWSAGEHMLRPMGSIFFKAATIREVCTE